MTTQVTEDTRLIWIFLSDDVGIGFFGCQSFQIIELITLDLATSHVDLSRHVAWGIGDISQSRFVDNIINESPLPGCQQGRAAHFKKRS